MIVSDRYKFVCLSPAKTGTGWRERMFLDHNAELQCRRTSRRHDDLYEQIEQFMDHDVIIVTRNPWDRLRSLWLMREKHGYNTGDFTQLIQQAPTQTNMIQRSGGFDRVWLFDFATQQQSWKDWFRTRHNYQLHVPVDWTVPWSERATSPTIKLTHTQQQLIGEREHELIKHQQYMI